MKIKVAFTGWAGSGKTEAARYLALKYDAEVVSFADGIKFIDSYLFGNTKKDRNRLQKIGEFFRGLDSDIWVKRTLETAECEDSVFIDDLRRMNEYETLMHNGFYVIRIVADENLRIARLIERDGQCDTSLLYNSSENGCANLTLTEISNNSTLEEFYYKLDEMMESLNEAKDCN